ncbi:MAG: CocE/NonD family hydrolase [Acidimicrobiia bacterium]
MRNRTNEIELERDVKVPMRDGTVLLADVFHPVDDGGIIEDAPTILERTPYGRTNIGHFGGGPEFAKRGYRYIVQACRGTDGSEGQHSFFGEAEDGRDTADWIAEQPWFDGRLGSYGASYMGFTQWALASTKPPHLQAMAVALSTSMRQWSWFCGDSVALELIVSWDLGAMDFGKPDATPVVSDVTPEAIAERMEQLRVAYAHLPVGDIIRFMKGEDYPFFLEQLAHAGLDDPKWSVVDFRTLLPDWSIPTLLVDGWHDYPLPGVIRDYAVLRDAPAPVHLRIGAGGHLGGGGEGGMTDAPLDWFDTYLLGRPGLLDDARPVAVHIQGDTPEWRRYENWPPPATPTNWYLQPDGALATSEPPESAPDSHRYDPADPTPAVGGIGMISGGMAENSALEARDDVLVYTSDALAEPLVLLGPVHAEIHLGSTTTTPTCSCACATCTPTARRTTCATRCSDTSPPPSSASGAGPTACSSPRSTCGRRGTASARATACACRCRAARTPPMPATSAPTNRSPPRCARCPRCTRSTTPLRTRRTWCCPTPPPRTSTTGRFTPCPSPASTTSRSPPTTVSASPRSTRQSASPSRASTSGAPAPCRCSRSPRATRRSTCTRRR